MKKVACHAAFEQKIDKSKFIGYCYPVESRDEAEECIGKIERNHYKATHVCPAYRIQGENEILAFNSDDGEPSRSAGPPIESAIEGRDLVNTLCVVVRYFGGVKLGIGGLIRAYGGTAGETLDKAGFETFEKQKTLELSVSHQSYPELLNVIQMKELDFEQNYTTEGAIITLELPEKDTTPFVKLVKRIEDIEILK